MKAEDQQVVEALKKILKDYDYLEYDEKFSSFREKLELHVKVTNSDAIRNANVLIRIRDRLEDATNRKFMKPLPDSYNWHDTNWTAFVLCEENEVIQ